MTLKQLCDGILHDLAINESLVVVTLKSLDPNSSVGSGGIPSRLLKNFFHHLAQTLCSFLWLPLRLGIFHYVGATLL